MNDGDTQFLFAIHTFVLYLFSIPLEKYICHYCQIYMLPHSQKRINVIAGVCVCTASDSR
jgi:hypothetical protein